MSQQHIIDLPAFGASASTIATRLSRLDPQHHPDVDEALVVRFFDEPKFEVRGFGDHDLIAQLLVRAAVDNGYPILRVLMLSTVTRECLPLIDHLEQQLPSVITLEVGILGLQHENGTPCIEFGPRATPDEVRHYVHQI
ncbi:MAG: hypothetical protein L0G89_07230 [Janibacter sp.]|nr:hypothetical protein [Janibacter sp.]